MIDPQSYMREKSKRTGHNGGGFEKRLANYLTAAGAAGVGMLALAQPARAEIVYTPVHKVIEHDGVLIDINHDGRTDFEIFQATSLDSGRAVSARGVHGTDDIANGAHFFALNFKLGSSIGGSANFKWLQQGKMATTYVIPYGYWVNSPNGYLGLRIAINGQWHYGWARLSVEGGKRALLTGYAYETVPDQYIKAGQTSGDSVSSARSASTGTLGALALGAPGLDLWRRQGGE